ncbi:tetratricopeptide repeat protein [Blastopirellula sp. JC732]|uniref:Tetratricopeptide repeat protein n=1 Tax=Blastopirellula sediminis TaxID=2894196 RepID=A0A9X1SIR6_9BACT|nr:tetratricopeptide repeat protein [Blastopirellula sediminis]MCC9605609.1 tetratricopeptide repeat protein [Blastopirellula sediminis]MCC9631091.1 tetratricopeptide repeat protein [Blastopirellula sediminis]
MSEPSKRSTSSKTWLYRAAMLVALACTGCQMASTSSNVAGVRAVQNGQPMVAVNQFQQALANDPTNADALYNMAATYHEMAKTNNDQAMLQQAEYLYNQCLDQDPNHTDCYRGLAVLLIDTKQPDRAYKLMEGWAQRNPTSADPKVELARLYQEFGDDQTALAQLNQAVAIDANNARAWAALGSLREKSGDYSQALANYQRSLALNNFQDGVNTRVATLVRQGVQADTPLSPTGDTRIVQNPNTTQRY